MASEALNFPVLYELNSGASLIVSEEGDKALITLCAKRQLQLGPQKDQMWVSLVKDKFPRQTSRTSHSISALGQLETPNPFTRSSQSITNFPN